MEESQSPAAPKVSAVILSYNRAADLRRCLEALEASTNRAAVEIIVVDAGSRDESPTLDTEFPEVTIQRMPRNFGATKALNIGARTAKGEYILFLDPGVEMPPDGIQRLSVRLDSDQDAAAVCPALVTPAGEPADHVRRLPRPEDLPRVWRDEHALDAPPGTTSGDAIAVQYASRLALMVRQFNLRGINYLDEHYGEFWADADLCFQILRAGKKILLLPDIRATLHPAPETAYSGSVRGLLDADRASGAARYASKHYGVAAGIRLRLSAVLYSLGQALAFRDPGSAWPRLIGIVSGRRVNGTQTGY